MDSGDPGAPGQAVVRPVEEESKLEKESVTLQLRGMEGVTVMEWTRRRRIEFAMQNLVSYKRYYTFWEITANFFIFWSTSFLSSLLLF